MKLIFMLSLKTRSETPIHRVDGINSDGTVEIFTAALGLSLGNGYISKRVFSIPKFGMINVHSERLPEYQNAQSVIWPIYNRAQGFNMLGRWALVPFPYPDAIKRA